ncbi:MAG: choice-of-anchor tandem repeat GloVer-containing protein [Candidatus Korobacteraceae bacterium]
MSSLALSELIGAPAIDSTGSRAGKVREVTLAPQENSSLVTGFVIRTQHGDRLVPASAGAPHKPVLLVWEGSSAKRRSRAQPTPTKILREEAMHTGHCSQSSRFGLAKMACIIVAFCAAMAVISPAQTLTTLVNFAYTNGAEPLYESLVPGPDGNLYGTTNGAGAHNGGIVFKMTPGGTLTVLYSFCGGSNCTDGNAPDTGLTLGSDGNFYGVTTAAGAKGDGTVFKITPGGDFTLLHTFTGSDGAEPQGALVLASDGNFYGTTTSGGSHDFGTAFRITPSGAFTTIYNFCSLGSCADGSGPFGGLLQGADGYLYGTTTGGGTHFLYGTVFKIGLTGGLTTLHSFAASDGSSPNAKLLQASDGNFYGTTTSGGNTQACTFGCGTIFRITAGGSFTSLHSFDGADGSFVTAGLIQASDGNFYGVAGRGGSSCGCGTIFKITAGGTLTVLHNFAGFPTEGSLPVGGLLEASNGNFYGTTESGGSTGDGSIFSLTGFTTTVVTGTPNPSEVGQLVTLTANVSPSGPPMPTGTVNFTSNGTEIPGCTAVPLSSSMAVCMTSSLALGTDTIVGIYSGDSNYAGSSGTLTQIVDPVPSPIQFVAVTPCRVVDTRQADGTFGGPPILGNSSRSFPLEQSGNPCDIPSDAVAYSLNVTVVPMGPLGYLTIWPTGQGQPVVSTLNSPDGRVKANAAIVPAGTPSGSVSVYVANTSNVILDIDGYFAPPAPGTYQFYPLTPCRIVDTRGGDEGILHAGMERDYLIPGNCGVPSSAKAYSFNVTVLPSAGGLDYLTVWPQGEPQPGVSTLNDNTGTIVANAAIVPAGSNSKTAFYAHSNSTNLLLDVNGYFAPPGTGGFSMYPVTPCRVLDTRRNNGQPFMGEKAVNVVGSACAPPSNAAAYIFNATVVPPGSMPFLTLWPDGEGQPGVSTLNAYDGFITSNMAIVPTNDGSIDAYAAGLTQLLLDISGYFAP